MTKVICQEERFLDNLEELLVQLESFENSPTRQTAQYHLKQLCLLNFRTGDSEIGPTSFSRKKLDLLRRLSKLGADSLFG